MRLPPNHRHDVESLALVAALPCLKSKTNTNRGKQEREKAAELEKQNNMSSMRVSGPGTCDPDDCDRFSRAVRMKIAAPVLLDPAAVGAYAGGGGSGTGSGTGSGAAGAPPAAESKRASGGEQAAGKEAGGGPAAAAAPCAKCEVPVHRECYGVPEGLGAPGAVGERRGCRFSFSYSLSCLSFRPFVAQERRGGGISSPAVLLCWRA